MLMETYGTNPISEYQSKARRASNKRCRTQFKSYQLNQLMKEFERNKYVNRERRIEIARQLDLTQRQVKVWFQNARMKSKQLRRKQSGQNFQSDHYSQITNENKDKEIVFRLLSYSQATKIVDTKAPSYLYGYWAPPPPPPHSNNNRSQSEIFDNIPRIEDSSLMQMDDFDLVMQVINEDEIQQIVESITRDIS